MEKRDIIRLAVKSVKLARSRVEDIQFSPEDAARTEPDFLVDVVRAAVEAGATTINVPDTVGYAVPDEFGALIGLLFEQVPGLDACTVHVHCHDDLGLAVANSLAAVRYGARGIECTVNGLGERAGNSSLEEVVMAIRTRSEALGGVWTGVNTREIHHTSRLVSQLTGMIVQRNKAIVGANAFAHEAGIHQDGMLKKATTYEIMSPEDVGIQGTELVLGKHSGRHALKEHLVRMGFTLDAEALERCYEAFIQLADKKKAIYDDDLVAIVQEQISGVPQCFVLEYLHVSTGSATVPTATVRLRREGNTYQDAACGDGPVDAVLKTIERISGEPGKVLDFAIHAITQGKDAVGEVSIQVRFDRDIVVGKGSSTDIIEASAKAYLNSLNRYLFSRRQASPGKKASPRPRSGKPAAAARKRGASGPP
jgi:2-isopropylmalate synthase